ncbi:hypothetical protein BDZ89DRAFT_1076359, partial [Hymenopellis radicata]
DAISCIFTALMPTRHQLCDDPLQTLCRSNAISRCSSCTEITQQTTDVLLQVSSETGDAAPDDHVNIRLAMIEDIVKDLMHYHQRHKAVSIRFWHPFKHDETRVQTIRQQLCDVGSVRKESYIPRDVIVHPAMARMPTPTPAPRWTKYVRIMSWAVETILNSIPVVSPLSIIPKAVAVAAAAFDNSEAREELNLFVDDVQSVGNFRRLEGPLNNFRHVAETMDIQPPFKRLTHAASDEQLLNNADKTIARGLLLENLDQSHQALQIGRRLEEKLNTITISFLGICFFSVTEARSDEISFSCAGGKAAWAH